MTDEPVASDAFKQGRHRLFQMARDPLLVLGHQDSAPHVAAALGLPVPLKGEFVSARVVEVGDNGAGTGPTARIAIGTWRVAMFTDSIGAAPLVPRTRVS